MEGRKRDVISTVRSCLSGANDGRGMGRGVVQNVGLTLAIPTKPMKHDAEAAAK